MGGGRQSSVDDLSLRDVTGLAEYLVVEESESLVDVGENPGVGIDVEAVYHLKN